MKKKPCMLLCNISLAFVAFVTATDIDITTCRSSTISSSISAIPTTTPTNDYQPRMSLLRL